MTATNATSDQIDQFEAAKTGNLQWFKQQHAAGTLPDLMVADTEYQHVIEYAAENGHLDVVKYLIEESGQNIDVTADDNYALRYAATHGRLNVVKYLIEDSGQDVDVTAYNHYAFRFAAENGHLNVVKYLIENCTQDVDVTADESYALRYAAENGHLDVVKYLIEECEQDVDATACNNYAIRYAAKNNHLDIVKYLIEKYPQHIDLPVISQTLLQIAVDHERSELITYLTPICETAEIIGLTAYKKIRPLLINSEASDTVVINTTTTTTNTNATASEHLSNNVSEISEASCLSFTDKLQYLSAIPNDVLQTLSASAEGLQQLRDYLQKASSNARYTCITASKLPRL